jgi:fibronectin-binding autotransporter adhesin
LELPREHRHLPVLFMLARIRAGPFDIRSSIMSRIVFPTRIPALSGTRRRSALFVSAATLAIALSSTAARAQCVGDAQVLCAGQSDPFVMTVPNGTVTVQPGATVGSPAVTDAALRFDVGGALIVNGSVLSQGPAVLLADAAGLDVKIGRAGTLSGANALRQDDDAGNYIRLDNSGLVRGTDGAAVRARSASLDLQNRAGGRIEGGLDVYDLYGTNAGTIEAGDASAIAAANLGLDNRGTVANNSATEAAIVTESGEIENSGMIEARGTAPAIAAEYLDLRNNAGGVIRSAGDTAIQVSGAARIENAGEIVGDVRTDQYYDSFYQRAGGSIIGSVSLGAGDDQFWREGRANGFAAPPTGGVDGGEGIDTYGVRMTGSGTIAFDPLPTGFERYGIDLCGCDLNVTIAAGSLTGGLDVTGPGIVTNLADWTYSGAREGLLLSSYSDYSDRDGPLTYVNRGTLNFTGIEDDDGYSPYGLIDGGDYNTRFINDAGATINLSGTYAYGVHSSGITFAQGEYGFVNRGTINANGDDYSVAVGVQGSGYNSGTISSSAAYGTALNLYGPAANFLNDTGGVIRGERAVTLDYGATLTNRGSIVATGAEAAVTGLGTQYTGPNTLINEGEIRAGSGAAVEMYSVAPSGNNIANKGSIVGDVVLSGSGNDTVWLAEGSAVQGNLSTGDGNDKLIVDLGRVKQDGTVDTSGLVSGTVDMGAGNNVLQARAGSTQTFSVLQDPVTGFSGGTVYEAAGADTVLTLQGPLDADGEGHQSYDGLLRLTGDGRIVLDMPFNNGGYARPSILVERSSTAELFGDNSQGLDLVIGGSVIGGTTGIAVDATYARRVELLAQKGFIGITGGTALKVGQGTEVLISNSTDLRKSGAAYGLLIDADGSTITNRSTIWEDSKTPTASSISTGVSLKNSIFINDRGNVGIGRIRMLGTGIRMENSEVYNSGDIISSYSNAIETTGYGVNRIVNSQFGTIQGHAVGNVGGTAGAAIVGGEGNDIVENAGTITGDVLLGGGEDLYVATGGKVTGNLDMGDGNDTVLTRGGSTIDVSGTATGGDGADAIGRSFTTSGIFDLATNTLGNSFELHGVEASGATTEVTVTSATTQTAALRVLGDGKVTNNASFDIADLDNGVYAAIEASDPRQEGGLDLVNNGTINSAVGGVHSSNTLSSFVNTAAITARNTGVYIERYGAGAFTMTNSGAIKSTEGRGLVVISESFDEQGNSIDVTNSGSITSSARDEGAVDLYSEYGGVKLGNTGTISAAGDYASAARVAGNSFDVTNGGTIQATGKGGTGLLLTAFGGLGEEDCIDPTPVLVGTLVNTGKISANGGGSDAGSSPAIATGAFAALRGDYGIIRMTNAAGASIEATGGMSTALLAAGLDDEGYGSTGVDAALRFFELDNLGTIRGGADTVMQGDGNFDAGDVDLDAPETAEGSDTYVVAGGIQTVNTTDKIRNLAGGTIIGNVDLADGNDVFENYGTLQGDLRLGEGDDTFVYAASGNFTGTAYGGTGNDTLLVDVNGGGTVDFDQFRQFETLSQRGTGSITIRGTTDLEALNMAGSNVTVAAGTRFDTQGATALIGSDAAESVIVSGTIGGGLAMGGGNDTVTLNAGGGVEGNIDLGAGNDRLVLAGGTATGLIDGGDGIDTVAFEISQDTSDLPSVTNFESLDVSGNARLTIGMNQDFDTVTLRNGADLTLNPGSGDHHIGNIIGDDSAQSVILNTALTGGVSLGGGDDSLTMSLVGTLSGALDGGAGNDVLNLTLTGASTIAGGIASFETINVAGGSPLTLGGTIGAGQTLNFDEHDNQLIVDGGSILGTVNGGAGHDALVFNTLADQTATLATAKIVNFEDILAHGAGNLAISGNGTFQTISVDEGDLTIAAGSTITAGATEFGAANNVLTLASGATLSGTIDGGDGTDRLVLNQAANTVRKLSTVNATGFEQLESGDSGELIVDHDAQFEVVDLFGAKLTVAAGSTLTMPTLQGNDGANTLNVQGTLAGNVALGAGDDRLTIGHSGAITGTASGGTGYDTLEFNTQGTYAAPTAWNGQGYDAFEAFNVAGGVVSLTGNVSYDTISVTGGRLIGQAGTTITSAKTLVVGQGATFGTAGIVNANIEVRGTLSPGASPGTMSVNGNVLFTNGSNLLLEMAPTGSDRLNISGTMTIQAGATLDITGMLQSTPGGALDLVVAQGGITGGFTTINKSNTVFGFVMTRGNRIQLVGEFQNNTAFGTNVQDSIRYANVVLAGGSMVQPFTNALPALVETNGTSRAAGFAQLSPEAFAAAEQASIDNGLAVIDAVRTLDRGNQGQIGFYGFAQGMYQESGFDGNAVTGAHDLRSDSRGLLGGFGYGMSENARVNAFVSTLSTNQTVEGLGATTKLDGMQLGISASGESGAFGIRGVLAYDLSRAETRRIVPGGNAHSRYDMGGLLVDVSADYQVALGSLRIAPRVGLSFVQGRREQATERGSDFAMTALGHKSDAFFGDAALAVSYDLGGVKPWAEAGIRQQLSGDNGIADASFANVTQAGVVGAWSAERGDTMAHLALGVTAPLSRSVRLNVSYSGEYGAGAGTKFGDSARHSVNAGLSVAF